MTCWDYSIRPYLDLARREDIIGNTFLRYGSIDKSRQRRVGRAHPPSERRTEGPPSSVHQTVDDDDDGQRRTLSGRLEIPSVDSQDNRTEPRRWNFTLPSWDHTNKTPREFLHKETTTSRQLQSQQTNHWSAEQWKENRASSTSRVEQLYKS